MNDVFWNIGVLTTMASVFLFVSLLVWCAASAAERAVVAICRLRKKCRRLASAGGVA